MSPIYRMPREQRKKRRSWSLLCSRSIGKNFLTIFHFANWRKKQRDVKRTRRNRV